MVPAFHFVRSEVKNFTETNVQLIEMNLKSSFIIRALRDDKLIIQTAIMRKDALLTLWCWHLLADIFVAINS